MESKKRIFKLLGYTMKEKDVEKCMKEIKEKEIYLMTEMKKRVKASSKASNFDNPYAKKWYKTLSKEQKEYYKEVGKNVYESIDYENIGTDKYDPEEDVSNLVESVAYLEECLKSGMHPSTLSREEKNALIKTRGDDWYVKWGFTKEELEGEV